MAAAKTLRIINARENNLKNVSLEIQHDRLTVVTGLSGSGKSSLAFDTVYAEGQRRYIETFSPYTRQFFDKVKKPDVDVIENVRPAIAIQQRTRVTNSRSTVGSMTNINDYLKIFWTNLSTPLCPACGIELHAWDAPGLAAHLQKLLALRHGRSYLVCAPVTISQPKKNLRFEMQRLGTLGFSRWFHPDTQELITFDDEREPVLYEGSTLIVVLDRVRTDKIKVRALQESLEQAFQLSRSSGTGGRVWILDPQPESRGFVTVIQCPTQENRESPRFGLWEFNAEVRCPHASIAVDRPRPSLFTYNHPHGACPTCRGFGSVLKIDPSLVVPNPTLSIADKALNCWASEGTKAEFRRLIKFCEERQIPTELGWEKLTERQRQLIFDHKSKEYRGVNHWFKALERKAYKMHVRVFLARYRGQFQCPECRGTRLRAAALAYQIRGKTLPDIWQMQIKDLLPWLKQTREEFALATKLPREVDELFSALIARLRYLLDLGLPYLTLDRQARTLSGGETQRVNLAAALGSDLISTHFVLDEPSVGLHSRDTQRLIAAIRSLKERGNSLLVVEHDLECIDNAEEIIELGPKAGREGGSISFNGPRAKWPGIVRQPIALETRSPSAKSYLHIRNACARNLSGFSLQLPLGSFIALTGVSGSGKSTLVHEVIKRRYDEHRMGIAGAGAEDLVSGFEAIDQLLVVDQTPLAKSPRGNIGTYTGIWDSVRELLASSDDAIARGLSKSSFSFNVDGGRCPECRGAGFIREDMQFLSDVYIPCERCLGKRFQQSVLEVSYRGLNAHDFLQMSIDECARLFHNNSSICGAAETLSRLGLGHLSLGNPLSELSGGEAQRLKLVPFIEQSGKGSSLLIFDEPTTGLHFHDVERLISLFKDLRGRGHTVLCVEHNLELIAASDWIIDLGPEGGSEGGRLLFEGTPAQLVEESKSHTAQHLQSYIRKESSPAPVTTTKKSPDKSNELIIKGAREHNLKNVDVRLPLNKLIAICGVSGSGKSTIAKDIIYAEGQRRYLDCLSPYARQFIKELKRPDIDEITNVMPTICVYQHTFQPSKLSTIGTMSEIYNYLRLLYSKIGIQHCPDHPEQSISPLAPDEIARQIRSFRAKSVRILAPIIKGKKGHHRTILERAIASEITQIRVDGVFLSPATVAVQGGLERTKAHTIEFMIGKFSPAQVDQAMVEDCVRQGLALSGATIIAIADNEEVVFSTERTCPICKTGFFKLDPEDLSFSSRRGACEECGGSGLNTRGAVCPECQGSRLNPLARNLRLGNRNIYELSLKTAPELEDWFSSLSLNERAATIVKPILDELLSRAATLSSMGLAYLPLARDCATLSGGELQRLRLATAMGSPLTGAMYIFDEPSAGLHPSDNSKVLGKLRGLRDRGNSVVMIEHDPESILSCEHVLDVGPGGGRHGGEIVFNGSCKDFISSSAPTAVAIREEPTSLTARTRPAGMLEIMKGSANNIERISLALPLGELVVVAGVSGAGKSSLVRGIIAETILHGKGEKKKWQHGNATVSSSLEIERLIEVDQKPIGINSRSTPASYLGIWDEIRNLFAKSIEARSRGWTSSFFSYNTGKGRCAECKGQGQIKIEMSFLPDAFMECESCHGSRYGNDANSVLYQGLTISQTLALTFEEAMHIFVNHRTIYQPLRYAVDLGLGYITLGQSSTSLSGGESQRLKLVAELGLRRRGHTLYILDEPTTGLHKSDVHRLLRSLHTLIDGGNSVIVIEHDVDVLRGSDQVIELGPGPGREGGKIIFQGAPRQLASAQTPWGEFLRLHAQGTISKNRREGESESANATV